MTAEPSSSSRTDGVRSAIRSRRSVRRFRPDPVSENDISELIASALWSPSPHNAQPWRFVSLRPETKWRLARSMAERLRSELQVEGVGESERDAMANRSIGRIDAAPNALLCSIVAEGLRLTGRVGADELEERMAVQSVGAALQSLFLLAPERGLGTCWMAAPMYCPDIVLTELSLPSQWQPQALILLGYPEGEQRIRPRLPIDQVLEYR